MSYQPTRYGAKYQGRILKVLALAHPRALTTNQIAKVLTDAYKVKHTYGNVRGALSGMAGWRNRHWVHKIPGHESPQDRFAITQFGIEHNAYLSKNR